MAKQNKLKPICFFITPIGAPESEERKRADQIQRFILNESLSMKYKIVRADELPHPGSITHQIIKLLYDADLVIADLTGANANVAYELAIRHSFNKICIQLIDKADNIPFDLKDERTIVFDINDISSVNECKEELKKTVSVLSGGKFKYNSPVFRTVGAAAATSEETKEFIERIADQIESIATDVGLLETTISMSDIDEISTIENYAEKIMKDQSSIERDIYDIKYNIDKILQRLK